MMLLLPFDEMRQESLHGLLVADQIVVDEVEMAAIAQGVERVEFRHYLLGRLRSRHAAIKFNNVAEFAGEWAAARKLHANEHIVLEIQKIESRDRACRDVGLELGCNEIAPAHPL